MHEDETLADDDRPAISDDEFKIRASLSNVNAPRAKTLGALGEDVERLRAALLEAERAAATAQRNATNARNRLSDAQKTFDEKLAAFKTEHKWEATR